MMLDMVIDEIIKRLSPLKNLYSEIEPLINDLKEHKFENLDKFINKYYQNVFYSLEFRKFVSMLQEKGLIKSNYKNYFQNENQYYEIIDFYFKNRISLNGFTPINVNMEKFNNFKDYYGNEKRKNNSEDDTELLSLDEDNIALVRKKLLEAQLNYLNKPIDFIQNLENMDESDIYNSLLNLGNISYIQHCISNLSIEILKKLLNFVEEKELNEHSLINIFIEESIKRNLHLKKNSLKK